MNWQKGDRVRNSRTGDRGTVAQVVGNTIQIHHGRAPGLSANTQERLEQAGWELVEE